jgi:hypothetical protein
MRPNEIEWKKERTNSKKQTMYVQVAGHSGRSKQKSQEKRSCKACKNDSDCDHSEDRKQAMTVDICGRLLSKWRTSVNRLSQCQNLPVHCPSNEQLSYRGNIPQRLPKKGRSDPKSRLRMAVEIRRLQCAGVNRHEAEEEESLRERTSEPLGPEFCTGHREVLGEA